MPAPDSPAILVARFLKCNGYDKTLAAFLLETGLDASKIDAVDPTAELTIEKVLEEKKLFDLSLQLERTEIIGDGEDEFKIPYPSVPTDISHPEIPASNVLFVSIESFSAPFSAPLLISSTADRALRLYSTTAPYSLQRSFTHLHGSAIVFCAVLRQKWIISSSMSGHVVVSNADTGAVVYELHDHVKFAIRVVVSGDYLATAAYDKSVNVYKITYTGGEENKEDEIPQLKERIGKLTFLTHPEAITFVTLPTTGELSLVVARRDSTALSYYKLTTDLPEHSCRNLSPGSSHSWSTYHPMSLSTHPQNSGLLGVATSSVPHMKFLVVKIDSEEVLKEVFTGAPQSPYSTAVLGWRPDGSGVWVNADDGIVRGVEVRSGKVKAVLEVCGKGEKVRTLWVGEVDGREWIVTGGFDKGLKVWRMEGESERG